jgi:predicted AlkP superfamily pyrophosphatase or phosphodiesterase
VIYPNFRNTLIDIINDFKENYTSHNYKNKDIFDKEYENTIIIILDGMGKNILNNFNKLYPDNFLNKHYLRDVYSIYPSTTAAATTSIISGLCPIETGWTGWQNYFREINANVILFTGNNYYTGEKEYIDSRKLLPYKPYYDDIKVKGSIVEPDFSNKKYKFSDTLKRSLKLLKEGYKTMYLYDETPDRELHMLGTNNKIIYEKLNEYSKSLSVWYNRIPNNTLVVISADHGHKDVVNLSLYLDDVLNSYLKRLPSNDSRCVSFSVYDNLKDSFVDYFNKMYGKYYKLFTKEEIIKNNYFGYGKPQERIDDFLSDFVAFATCNLKFCFHEDDMFQKSSHAGTTEEEMIVPLIVFKK